MARIKPRRLWIFLGILTLLIIAALWFPNKLFDDPYSTLILDVHGELLSAQIAEDGQWRFPEVEEVPENLKKAILHFEDEYFYFHPGVNPISLVRAIYQNIKAGRVTSGGSTISMQVVRLSRKNQPRTYWEKIREIYLAMRMEFTYSKREILSMYISHAPYGGNVVGAEAAAWRYFNRPLKQLSWSEVCMLAVLPNSPALIHPGRNRDQLTSKRDFLLHKLWKNNVIDSITYELAKLEPIPKRPRPLPNYATHLLNFISTSGLKGQRTVTTIDKYLQQWLSGTVNSHVSVLAENEIKNASAIVISLRTGAVRAYVGNANRPGTLAPYVDILQSPRSSGSILKPFLYGKAIEQGLIHPKTLLSDVPITIGNLTPTNFDNDYDGSVKAGDALCRSLNIPATLLLRDYGIELFHKDLKNLGLTTLNRPASHYGLTLVLGGAEVKLWDLAKAYTFQAQSLLKQPLNFSLGNHPKLNYTNSHTIDEGAWWLISNTLTQVQRPDLDKNWRRFSSSRKIAWKTGTSYGFRDAWAIGYNSDYLVGVWVGNADGEGRPGLTGISAAAPLMFKAFQSIEGRGWFEKPSVKLISRKVCAQSGLAPSPFCPTVYGDFPKGSGFLKKCEYHQRVLLNANNERVFKDCSVGDSKDTVWFQLPPVENYYYKRKNANYQPIPKFAIECLENQPEKLAIIYPQDKSKILIPKDFDGNYEYVRLEATHNEESKLFWHLDEQYIGTTSEQHYLRLKLEEGSHRLMVIDEKGNSAKSRFNVKAN